MADFKSAAVVVWMPKGEKPGIKSFETEDDQMPETAGCWELGVALIRAALGPSKDGKVAWVKVDDIVLAPDECQRAYERFKNGEPFNA
jgi:hypothetical protein